MSYEINDANGSLGPGPTINGLREMKQLLYANNQKDYSALSHFVEFGYTQEMNQLKEDSLKLAAKTQNAGIRRTLRTLAKYASKADEIVLLHQGVT